jgi:hypothetical protein
LTPADAERPGRSFCREGRAAQNDTAVNAPLDEFWRAIKLDLYGTFLGRTEYKWLTQYHEDYGDLGPLNQPQHLYHLRNHVNMDARLFFILLLHGFGDWRGCSIEINRTMPLLGDFA